MSTARAAITRTTRSASAAIRTIRASSTACRRSHSSTPATFHNGDYVETRRPDDQAIYSLTWTQDLPWATLTTAGSLYKRDFGFFRDNTWAIISLNVGPPGATACFSGPCVRPDLFPELTDQTQDIEQRTAEVRLNSTGTGPLSWLAGVFYRERESDFRSVSPIVDPATGLPFPVTGPPTGFSALPGAGIEGCQPCALARFNTRDIEESAVFGEISYKLFESFEVMAGLRQFTAEQEDAGFYLFQFPLFGGLPPPDHRHFKEDRLIKKFQLSFRPNEDVTIFALASEGFRLGGTNQPNIAAVPPGYEADSLWNYEVGVKTAWLDGRLIVNSSAFYIDWDNIQVSGRDPTGSFAFIGNAGAAEVQGLELETFFQPVRSLNLSAGLELAAEARADRGPGQRDRAGARPQGRQPAAHSGDHRQLLGAVRALAGSAAELVRLGPRRLVVPRQVAHRAASDGSHQPFAGGLRHHQHPLRRAQR